MPPFRTEIYDRRFQIAFTLGIMLLASAVLVPVCLFVGVPPAEVAVAAAPDPHPPTMALVGGKNEVQWVQWIKANLSEWNDAKLEYRLWDDSRVDMLTDKYAVEVDWAKKWPEAIGQATYYAEVTDKEPAVLLLVADRAADMKDIYRAQTVCARLHYTLILVELPKDE